MERAEGWGAEEFQRRILIVEVDVFMGSLMAEALSNQGFRTALAESAVAAKRLVGEFDPDAALVDVNLGDGPNGIEFIRMLRHSRSKGGHTDTGKTRQTQSWHGATVSGPVAPTCYQVGESLPAVEVHHCP